MTIVKIMKVIDPSTLAQYEKSLQKDPKSKIFAALADAYREVGQITKAEEVAKKGIQNHPAYVGGYVALGRILCQKKEYESAVPVLQKAAEIAPENILAYQLLGLCYIELSQPKEALKAHKMALFLNPLSEKSRQAVKKLEILSAEDFEKPLFDLPDTNEFQFQKLKEPKAAAIARAKANVQVPSAKAGSNPFTSAALERELSFVDALILRNELQLAHNHLSRLQFQGFKDPGIDERLELVNLDESIDPLLNSSADREPSHRPGFKKRLEIDSKINLLKEVLNQIQAARDARI